MLMPGSCSLQVGPALGGLLSTSSYEHATLGCVCGCYGLAFLAVTLFFERHVLGHDKRKAKAA